MPPIRNKTTWHTKVNIHIIQPWCLFHLTVLNLNALLRYSSIRSYQTIIILVYASTDTTKQSYGLVNKHNSNWISRSWLINYKIQRSFFSALTKFLLIRLTMESTRSALSLPPFCSTLLVPLSSLSDWSVKQKFLLKHDGYLRRPRLRNLLNFFASHSQERNQDFAKVGVGLENGENCDVISMTS